MNESNAEGPSHSELDAHLDAAIRRLDRYRRLGEESHRPTDDPDASDPAPDAGGTVVDAASDEAAGSQRSDDLTVAPSDDVEVDEDLFGAEPAGSVRAESPAVEWQDLPAAEAQPELGPDWRAADEEPPVFHEFDDDAAGTEHDLAAFASAHEPTPLPEPEPEPLAGGPLPPEPERPIAVESYAETPAESDMIDSTAIEAAAIESAPIESEAPIQRRMFSLRRALDTHRHGAPADDFPEFPSPAPPEAKTESPPESEAAPVAEPTTALPPAPEIAAERKGWFGSRRKVPLQPAAPQPAVPEPEVDAMVEAVAPPPIPEAEPAVSALEPATTVAETDEAAPESKPMRRGWFSRRKAKLAEPAAPQAEAAPPEPPIAAEPETPAVPLAAAAPAAAVATSATEVPPSAPPPKRERRRWFRRKRAAKPEPEAKSGPMVDLGPVREAMLAAARKRAEESKPEIAIEPAVIAPAEPSGPTMSAGAQPATPGRIGVLLVNLGTPDEPTPKAVRAYLREFLSDPRVIEKDSFLWQLVFRLIILPLRPRSKARAYRKIWNKEKDESPLKTVTRSQAKKLGEALSGLDDTAVVDWAMRYASPPIEQRIRALIAQGCERILVIPLYPQYSSATTATVCDEVFRVLTRIRNQPSLRVAPPYYADPVYVEAIATAITVKLAELSFVPDVILASFHGMPAEYVQKGDPYYQHCLATTTLLRQRLGMTEKNLLMTFQSRFGRAEWLQPYTDVTLRMLAKQGVKNVAVVTPGFSVDCLETLEEIAIENAHMFKKKGGKNFLYIPCLNDSERGMLVIWEIATRELKGWIVQAGTR